MKKIIKNLSLIGTAAIPVASVLSCADSNLSQDEKDVKENLNAIEKLPIVVTKEGHTDLASSIKTVGELNQIIVEVPKSTNGVSIDTTLQTADDDAGTLSVKYTVSKNTISQSTTLTYQGFLKNSEIPDEEAVFRTIVYIQSLSVTTNAEGKKVLPTEIVNQADIQKNILAYPSSKPPGGSTISALPLTPDDDLGTLVVQYTVWRGDVTETTNVTYSDFLTTIGKNILYIKSLSTWSNTSGVTTFPSAITDEMKVKQKVFSYPWNPYNDAQIQAVPIVAKADDRLGTLVVEYTITKKDKTGKVEITYSGFLTTVQVDKEKVDKNVEMITNLPTTTNTSAANTLPSAVKSTTQLNGFITNPPVATDGVLIQPVKYNPEDKTGALTVTYDVTKGGVGRTVDVSYTGFKGTTMVSASKKIPMTGARSIPNVYGGWTQQINDTHYLIGTTDKGVYQVTTDQNGDITESVPYPMFPSPEPENQDYIPSVQTGWVQKVDESHYLIGTYEEGVFQVTVDITTGKITKAKPIGLHIIPTVRNGFIISIGETTNYYFYLIGTYQNGVFKVAVNRTGEIGTINQSRTKGLPNYVIPDVRNGWAEEISSNPGYFLIGTSGSGIFQVRTETDSKAENMSVYSKQFSTAWSESVSQGWAQFVVEDTVWKDYSYLIGTNQGGVYQVKVDPKTGVIENGTEKQVPLSGNNSIPQVNTGWIQKFDDAHYLIGTHSNGVYEAEVDVKTGFVTKTTQIPMAGPINIPRVDGGFINRIGTSNKYWVGTLQDGLYQITAKLP